MYIQGSIKVKRLNLITYQNTVAINKPAPIQSIKMTYNKKMINLKKLSSNTTANPIEVTKIITELI